MSHPKIVGFVTLLASVVVFAVRSRTQIRWRFDVTPGAMFCALDWNTTRVPAPSMDGNAASLSGWPPAAGPARTPGSYGRGPLRPPVL